MPQGKPCLKTLKPRKRQTGVTNINTKISIIEERYNKIKELIAQLNAEREKSGKLFVGKEMIAQARKEMIAQARDKFKKSFQELEGVIANALL